MIEYYIPSDNNTVASTLCRSCGHVFVGKPYVHTCHCRSVDLMTVTVCRSFKNKVKK